MFAIMENIFIYLLFSFDKVKCDLDMLLIYPETLRNFLLHRLNVSLSISSAFFSDYCPFKTSQVGTSSVKNKRRTVHKNGTERMVEPEEKV